MEESNIAKRKFNEYEIRDDYAIIYINSKKHGLKEVLVDIDSLYKLKELGYRWCVSYSKHINNFYIHGNIYTGGKHVNCSIQTIILDCYNGEVIDHVNHDPFDNRKENLRITETKENTKHRKSKNSNNKSGYRNVCCIDGKFIVQLQVNGKNTKLGSFDDADEAGVFAQQMREMYYGEFAGNT